MRGSRPRPGSRRDLGGSVSQEPRQGQRFPSSGPHRAWRCRSGAEAPGRRNAGHARAAHACSRARSHCWSSSRLPPIRSASCASTAPAWCFCLAGCWKVKGPGLVIVLRLIVQGRSSSSTAPRHADVRAEPPVRTTSGQGQRQRVLPVMKPAVWCRVDGRWRPASSRRRRCARSPGGARPESDARRRRATASCSSCSQRGAAGMSRSATSSSRAILCPLLARLAA